MKTGYQIYVKGMNKDGTRSKKFKKAGLNNWFWNEHDAIDRMNKLVDTWKDFGFEYKIVKLEAPEVTRAERKANMEVCIVNTLERLKGGKGWQIMKRAGTGYNHVFPGALYTVEEAANICNENNFNIVAIGDFWECLKK